MSEISNNIPISNWSLDTKSECSDCPFCKLVGIYNPYYYDFDFWRFNNFSNQNSTDNDSTNIQRKDIFQITINKQRGRKKTKIVSNDNFKEEYKEYGKKHLKSAFDNIQTKIQVHFINFLIRFANDAINTEFQTDKKKDIFYFKYINYDDKKKIEHKYIENLVNMPIKDIICLDISTKYQKYGLQYNKVLYEELKKDSPWLKSFLDMKYIDAFLIYYNDELPLKCYVFKNKNIIISKDTQSFFYLKNKNKSLEKELANIAKRVYLDRVNRFMTEKKEN